MLLYLFMKDTLEFIKTFKKGWEYMNSVEDAMELESEIEPFRAPKNHE